MPGNKNSGRRDNRPRGGGRPRSRVILHMEAPDIAQLEAIAKAERATAEAVAQDAILGYIAEWQDGHASEEGKGE